MKNKTKKIIGKIFLLDEYQRKQIISILIASMLTDLSNKDAHKIYDEIINKLKTI
jgi:phenylalanyl-tRNA synthetase beta subunit